MALLNSRIILRNDTTVNWQANSTTILYEGEIGIEFFTDGSSKLKIGDGARSWAELPYYEDSVSAELQAAIDRITSLETTTLELVTKVDDHEARVAELEAQLTPSTEEGGTPTVFDRLEAAEEQIAIMISDADTENSIRYIATQIAKEQVDNFATVLTDNGTIDSFAEIVNYIAEHGEDFNQVITDINNLQSLVGDTSVAEQISAATAPILETLESIEDNAQENVIEVIRINDIALPVENKSVNIPIATIDSVGVVKGSQGENKIEVEEDGTMTVDTLNVNKLVQTEGEDLILNGGSSF